MYRLFGKKAQDSCSDPLPVAIVFAATTGQDLAEDADKGIVNTFKT